MLPVPHQMMIAKPYKHTQGFKAQTEDPNVMNYQPKIESNIS